MQAFLIPKAPVQRLLREIMRNVSNEEMRLSVKAAQALQASGAAAALGGAVQAVRGQVKSCTGLSRHRLMAGLRINARPKPCPCAGGGRGLLGGAV